MALSTLTPVCNKHHHPSPELFSSCKTETLSPVKTNFPFLQPLATTFLHLWFYRFDFFRIPYVSEIIQYGSFSDVFQLAQCCQGSSILLQMTRFHSFLWLNNIPVCVCICHMFLMISLIMWNLRNK